MHIGKLNSVVYWLIEVEAEATTASRTTGTIMHVSAQILRIYMADLFCK